MIIIKLGATLVYHHYACLKAVYDFVSIDLPPSLISGKKVPFDQFLIALMKLHLNLGDQDLA